MIQIADALVTSAAFALLVVAIALFAAIARDAFRSAKGDSDG